MTSFFGATAPKVDCACARARVHARAFARVPARPCLRARSRASPEARGRASAPARGRMRGRARTATRARPRLRKRVGESARGRTLGERSGAAALPQARASDHALAHALGGACIPQARALGWVWKSNASARAQGRAWWHSLASAHACSGRVRKPPASLDPRGGAETLASQCVRVTYLVALVRSRHHHHHHHG